MKDRTFLMEEKPSRKWSIAVAFSVELAGDAIEWQQWLRYHNWN